MARDGEEVCVCVYVCVCVCERETHRKIENAKTCQNHSVNVKSRRPFAALRHTFIGRRLLLLRWKWNRTHTCEKASRPMEQSPFGSVSRALDAVFARPCRGVPFFSAQHDSMWPMTEAGGRE